jgi:hypothetical protein
VLGNGTSECGASDTDGGEVSDASASRTQRSQTGGAEIHGRGRCLAGGPVDDTANRTEEGTARRMPSTASIRRIKGPLDRHGRVDNAGSGNR